MASLIVEGLMMLSYAVRDNLNPIIAKLISMGQKEELKNLIKLSSRIWYLIIFFIGVIAIFIYPTSVLRHIKRKK